VLFGTAEKMDMAQPRTSPNTRSAMRAQGRPGTLKILNGASACWLFLTSWKKCKLLKARLASEKWDLKLNGLLLKVFCREAFTNPGI
jgi:hypothetical protein